MKTMADIEDLLRGFPMTENGEGSVTPFGLEAHDSVSDEEIYGCMYDVLKEQVDCIINSGKQVLIRVYPVLAKRKDPTPDGSYRKDAYFRLAVGDNIS